MLHFYTLTCIYKWLLWVAINVWWSCAYTLLSFISIFTQDNLFVQYLYIYLGSKCPISHFMILFSVLMTSLCLVLSFWNWSSSDLYLLGSFDQLNCNFCLFGSEFILKHLVDWQVSILTQSSITLLYWLLLAAYGFLGISCLKTLVPLHSVGLCNNSCMEHQHCCIPIWHNLVF